MTKHSHCFTVKNVAKNGSNHCYCWDLKVIILYLSTPILIHKIKKIQCSVAIFRLIYNHSGTKKHCSTSVQPGTNCSATIVSMITVVGRANVTELQILDLLLQ